MRLGGAYELFHLAQDTPDTPESTSNRALDILCAHISARRQEKRKYSEKYKSKPSEEVQSLLTSAVRSRALLFSKVVYSADLQGSLAETVSYLKKSTFRKRDLLVGVHDCKEQTLNEWCTTAKSRRLTGGENARGDAFLIECKPAKSDAYWAAQICKERSSRGVTTTRGDV